MKIPENYNAVTPANFGEFIQLPPGGYVCRMPGSSPGGMVPVSDDEDLPF